MQTFTSYDGASLAYHTSGNGPPLLVLPGGPVRDPEYLGNLGGLDGQHTLHVLHPRGTGGSDAPVDAGSYRCDLQVDDVEAFRQHLEFDRVDMLAHSAGANLATLYAARHPDRIRGLALITPSLQALGIMPSEERLREAAAARASEPWFPDAMASLDAVLAGTASDQDRTMIEPFFYGRWDAAAQAHAASGAGQNERAAAERYFADGAFDPPATTSALANLNAAVLLTVGELDVNPLPWAIHEGAAHFPNVETAVHPGSGHFPWLDDAEHFTRTVAGFFARS